MHNLQSGYARSRRLTTQEAATGACSLCAPGCFSLIFELTSSILLGNKHLSFLMSLCHTAVGLPILELKTAFSFYLEEAGFEMHYIGG